MPAPTNLSFETAGATPGDAASWTTAIVDGFQDIAVFYPGTSPRPWDDFELGWTNDTALFAFVGVGTDLAVPNFTTLLALPKHFEDFEELWSSNQNYLFAMGPEAVGTFTGPQDFDDFETGWANVPYLLAFAPGDISVAVFTGPVNFDDFETWVVAPLFSFAPGDILVGLFDGAAPQPFEDFEEVKYDTPYAADPVTDVFSAPGHPFIANDPITLLNNGGVLPQPLEELVTYYAVTVVPGVSLQLALTVAGAPINLTTAGGGDVVLHGDPTLYWTEKLVV